MYSIEGEYNYFVDLKFNGVEPYSNSSFTIQCFSNETKKFAIGAELTYFYVNHSQQQVIDNKGYNSFHFSVDLTGVQLFVKVTPIEDFFKGVALIKFKTSLIHPHLRKRLLIYFPLEQGLKDTVKFGQVSLSNEKTNKRFPEFIIELAKNKISLRNFYAGVDSEIVLGEKNLLCSNLFYRESEVQFSVEQKFCLRFEKVKEELQLDTKCFTFVVLFQNRDDKELFLGLLRLVLNQNYLQNSQRIMEKSPDNFFQFANQMELLRQENAMLLKQVD